MSEDVWRQMCFLFCFQESSKEKFSSNLSSSNIFPPSLAIFSEVTVWI